MTRISPRDECNMVLYKAKGKISNRANDADRQRSEAFSSAAAPPALDSPAVSGRGVTFLKTLVSDYQILSPVSTFACTLGQQSSQYKPMTFPGRLLCAFCLIRSYRPRTSTYFDLSPGVVNWTRFSAEQ